MRLLERVPGGAGIKGPKDLKGKGGKFPRPGGLRKYEDVITPEAGCKKIAAAFARGEYRTLPGIGHVPHMEAAEAVNRLIAGFVPK